MFNFGDILQENFENYPEDVQGIMIKYTHSIKVQLKEALSKDFYNDMKLLVSGNSEEGIDRIYSMLDNGWKGYKELSMKSLLDLFLEKHSQEEFAMIMENIKL